MLTLASAPATAGIVNVQSVISVEAEEGLSGSVTGALDLRRGNTERFIFSLSPTLRYRIGPHLFITYGSGEYDEDNDDINKVFGHGRYRYQITPRLTGEFFTQVERTPGRSLDLRALAGIGPLVKIADSHGLRLSGAIAYMLEYEDVDDAVFIAGEEDPGLQHRISSYLTGSYVLADNLQLVETVYVQPLITDPNDVRLLNESQLSVTITSYLAFNASLNLAYDTRPSPAVNKKLDLQIKNSLTLQF